VRGAGGGRSRRGFGEAAVREGLLRESKMETTLPKKRLREKHPLAIRWFHWVNFPVLLVMIWSGVLILWANDVYPTERYRLKVPDRVSVYRWGITPVYADRNEENYPVPADRRADIELGFRLAEGMNWHFTFAWLFTLNGIAYVLYTALSGQWRHLLPRRDSFAGALQVVLHDLGLRKEPLPPGKFNHAQRIAYTGVIVMGALMVVTGLAIYKPVQLGWLVRLLGGYQAARVEHFAITCLFVLFFFVHIAQVVRAGWNQFRAMVTGHEVVPISGAAATAAAEEATS
jgi:thiosulfate reductase cytochrome b subunit